MNKILKLAKAKPIITLLILSLIINLGMEYRGRDFYNILIYSIEQVVVVWTVLVCLYKIFLAKEAKSKLIKKVIYLLLLISISIFWWIANNL